jgi:hypothetical protein
MPGGLGGAAPGMGPPFGASRGYRFLGTDQPQASSGDALAQQRSATATDVRKQGQGAATIQQRSAV